MLESFIKECTLMCSKVITKALCKLATEFNLRFCCEFELLFRKAACFPNMHFTCHIPSCLLRFGPAQGFWLFSFERYHGLLGEVQLNHKTITVQLMQHFLHYQRHRTKSNKFLVTSKRVLNWSPYHFVTRNVPQVEYRHH